MNIHWIILTLLLSMFAAEFAPANQSRKDSGSIGNVDSLHRSVSAIRTDVRAALCAEASTRRLGDNTPAVLRLIDLFHEMAAHPQRDKSVTLSQLGQRLRLRLKKVRDHIERQNSNSGRLAKKANIPSEVISSEYRVLAQQVVPRGGAAVGQGAGPAGPAAAAGRPVDYGPELVELIHQTISPATWDINGGNGSVVYYAPLRVLVVSAPGEVHHRVGGVLGQLRANP